MSKKKVLHKTCMFTMLNLFCHQGSIWRVAYNMRKFPHQLTLTTTLVLRISFSVPSWDTMKHQNIILLNLPLKQFLSYFINGQRLLSHLLSTCAKFGIFFSFKSFSDYLDLPSLSTKIYIFLSIFFISLEVFIWPPGCLWGRHPVTLRLWKKNWIHCLLRSIFSNYY